MELLSAKNNPLLSDFCPWIIWTSIMLKTLDLSSCPKLKLPHRVFKANPDLRHLEMDQVSCDCSPPVDKFKYCFNDQIGQRQTVDYFRQQNCSVNPELNQTTISATVIDPLRLDCDILDMKKFNHVMWITPLGSIKVLTGT